MLVESVIVVASIIPVMAIGKVIATGITGWRWAVPIVQTLISFVASLMVIYSIAGVSPYIVVPMIVYPILINIVSLVDKRRQRENALDGEYGVETQWAAELVESGDTEFAIAVNDLPKMDLKEVGIIADSKEELRRLTIERHDELLDESIPEDFKL